jgi:hypothetical protein
MSARLLSLLLLCCHGLLLISPGNRLSDRLAVSVAIQPERLNSHCRH